MTSDARSELPERLNLSSLRRAAGECTSCPLHEHATQTVFGEGLARSRLMLIGEQPGDREDVEGHPFVGPAGKLLDEGLREAGIERDDAYVTNAVKHFKWKETRGKRRIHDKPSRGEIKACMPWLEAELEVVGPRVVVCMGATATGALLGPKVRVTRDHGRPLEADDLGLGDRFPDTVFAVTAHPSSVLRAPQSSERRRKRRQLVADLEAVAGLLRG